MASTLASLPTASAAAAQAVLPDEILEEIFLRVDAATDLARVSATCSSFRGIVSDRRFLRRFRSLRSPAVLGLIGSSRYKRFSPVGPPHRSAPEARALEQAADFTFSFLPDPSAWYFRHAHDGRVLLSQFIYIRKRVEEFVVCDPLHRRYVMIPRIPDDLMASAGDDGSAQHLSPVLAPAGDNGEEESFRVICTVQLKGGSVMAFVFSSCDQTWHGISGTNPLPNAFMQYVPYYAHGCLYYIFYRMSNSLMLELDLSEMNFSIINLPTHNFEGKCAIVEAADGRLGFLTVGDGTIDLYCKNWQSNGVGTQEWLHNKLIRLPKESGIPYAWAIEGTAGHYLALVAHHVICDEPLINPEHFLLDIKTLLLEKLCTLNDGSFSGFPYARFPPPFALPSIYEKVCSLDFEVI